MPERSWSRLIVRTLDVASVASVLLSLTIYLTGGFREWMPWGRVSMTSWLRPLIIAALLIALRHVLQPRPSVVAKTRDALRAGLNATGVRTAVPIFFSTRASVLLAGLLAVALFGYREAGPPWRLYENELLNLPARWDTGWYIGIATEGYRWQPSRSSVQQNIAFFPAYPMMMRYLSLFLGRQVMWTGVLISWVAFFLALVYLYRFTQERFGDDAGRQTITLLACYPYALFFSTAYTEALFLLAVVGACHHFDKDQLWRAGAWGLLAGLTRPNGCLLSIVLALMAVRPLWQSHVRRWGATLRRLLVASLPGVGMLLYSAHVYVLTGNPLQWTRQNAAWGRVYQGIDVFLAEQAVLLDQDALYAFAATRALDVLQLAAVILVLVSAWFVYRRLGFPYAVLIVVNVVPPLLVGGLLSMGRVTSVLFPTFVWLGLVLPARHFVPLAVAFAMLQALLAATFFTWRPVF
jgi:hypothetical protein